MSWDGDALVALEDVRHRLARVQLAARVQAVYPFWYCHCRGCQRAVVWEIKDLKVRWTLCARCQAGEALAPRNGGDCDGR